MTKFRSILIFLLISVVTLSSCGSGEPSSTPTSTLSVDEIRTQAVGTFSADLTQTALAAPTNTSLPTATDAPAFAPFNPNENTQPAVSAPTSAPTTSCYGLTFVNDVTIPDNTPMTPGQTFTKTWKVFNSGSCAWDVGFKFASTGGDAMGGVTVTLTASVASGAQTEISVPMTAPAKTGTIRGNWRMSTAGGQYFGNEVYVVIVVGGSTSTNTSAAPTNTSEPPTATLEPTATPTP